MSENTTPQTEHSPGKRSISEVQNEHDNTLIEVTKQRDSLRKSLSCIEQLDLLINVLTYKMHETENHHRKQMEELQAQRQQLLASQDITEDQQAVALAELDKKISNQQNTHEATMLSMQNQKTELQRESLEKVKQMDNIYHLLKQHQEEVIAILEAELENASPSQADIYREKIAELKSKFEAESPELSRLQSSRWHNLNPEEKLAAVLEQRGIQFSKSGRLLTESGRSLTYEQAENAGYFQGIRKSWECLLDDFRNLQIKKEEFNTLSQESSAASVFSKMSSEDVHYLKDIMGKPLTLALAEIVAKQPRDPIHYLGHWLFKYRYNQEIDQIEKEKIDELTEEREKIAKEKWHKILQEEAKNAVLDIITKAEEEALQNEIDKEMARILAEHEAAEEENEQLLSMF